jgi:ribosomal protein S18 acetylase RimI-like enzyme
MEASIRPYHPSDLPALYRICRQASHDGATNTFAGANPDLPGHYFVGPYATLEPDLCFVVVAGGQQAGYICGTRDIRQFHQACEAEWFPVLRRMYPAPPGEPANADQAMIAAISAGIDLNDDVRAYPARLHIALLPSLQRQGWGRRLLQVFLARLRELHSPAVHLEVSTANLGAISFYEVLGFQRIIAYPGAIEFGMRLGEGSAGV